MPARALAAAQLALLALAWLAIVPAVALLDGLTAAHPAEKGADHG